MEAEVAFKDDIGDMLSELDKHSIDFQVTLVDALEDFVDNWLSKHNLSRTPPKKWKTNFPTAVCVESSRLSLLLKFVELLKASDFVGRFDSHLSSIANPSTATAGPTMTTVGPLTDSSLMKSSCTREIPTVVSDLGKLLNVDKKDCSVLVVANDIESLTECTTVNDGDSAQAELDDDNDSDSGAFVAALWMDISSGDARVESVAEADIASDVSNIVSVEQNVAGNPSHDSSLMCARRRRGRPRRSEIRPASERGSARLPGRPQKKIKNGSTDILSSGQSIKKEAVSEEGDGGSSGGSEKLVVTKSLRGKQTRTLATCGTGKAESDAEQESIENVEPVNIQPPAKKRKRDKSAGNGSLPNLAPNICEICGTVVKCLKSHLMKHSDPKYSCPYCPFASRQLQSVTIHISRLHTNYRPHLCEACGKGFVKSSLLKEHIREKHSANGRERRHKCSTCSYTAYTRTMVARHELKHRPCRVPEFRCDICDARLMTIYSLREHKRLSHVDDRPFPCTVCEFSAKSKKRLLSHLRCHEEKKFECPSCVKRFSMHAQLVRHQLVHSGARPFACPYCPYRAGIIENLRKHCSAVHKVLYPPRKRDILRGVDSLTVEPPLPQVPVTTPARDIEETEGTTPVACC